MLQEVNLQNENAWADLGKDKDDGGDNDDEDGEDEGKDVLWDEFKTREQEEEQRVRLKSSPFHRTSSGLPSDEQYQWQKQLVRRGGLVVLLLFLYGA